MTRLYHTNMLNFLNNFDKKKVTGIAILAVALIALPLIVFQTQKEQDIRQKAAGGTEALHVEFYPSALSIKKEESFVTSISLANPTNKDISAIDATITYDENVLELNFFEPITEVSGFTTIVNDTSIPGKIRYVGVNTKTTSWRCSTDFNS